MLCWLCTLSYKRALAKARQVESERRMGKKRPSGDKQMNENHHSHAKKPNRSDMNKQSLPEISDKVVRIANSVPIDPNSSDHVVAMTQLKEQIASLQKKLNQKDRELLEKDKLITELKGKNFTSENELRNKMKDTERIYDTKVDILNKKVAKLIKEVATLSKQNKRNGGTTVVQQNTKDSGGSGTDSPSTN